MKAKIKNNKIKNTGILFESLVRQITRDVLSGKKSSEAVLILNKHFNSGSELIKEYSLYKTILDNKNKLSSSDAETLLEVLKNSEMKLDKKKLKREKYLLVKSIKNNYDLKEFLRSNINDYKVLASTYKFLQSLSSTSWANPNEIYEAKKTILEYVTYDDKKNQENDLNSLKNSPLVEEYLKHDKDVRLLAYKIFMNKYNEKYKNLNDDQKSLLRKYIYHISTSGELNNYVIKEFKRVKGILLEESQNIADEATRVKTKEIANHIDDIIASKKNVESKMEQLMHYYELLEEVRKINGK